MKHDLPTLVAYFSEAIARMEGYFNKENTVAQRNNNPGNLRSWGANPVVGGYARFATLADGWAALRAQITKNIAVRKLSLPEFFAGTGEATAADGKPYAGYAPAADNNKPYGYARFVQLELNQRGIELEFDKPIIEQVP